MKSKVVEGTIVGYLRTSTDKQEINNQRLEILEYARKEGLKAGRFMRYKNSIDFTINNLSNITY